jgi:hypothetical protein
LTTTTETIMITHDPKWSLPCGRTPVPSRWQATRRLLIATKARIGVSCVGPGQPVNGIIDLEGTEAGELHDDWSADRLYGRPETIYA